MNVRFSFLVLVVFVGGCFGVFLQFKEYLVCCFFAMLISSCVYAPYIYVFDSEKQWVIGIEDFLVQGMETPICRPDLMTSKVCCFPRDWIQDITGISKAWPIIRHCYSFMWALVILQLIKDDCGVQ